MSEVKIEGTGGQDVFVGAPSRKKRNVVIGVVAAVVLLAAYPLFSYLRGYVSADSFFERSKLRSAVVSRGDFQRTISVEGNVVATFSPTLYAQDEGDVFLHVEEGDNVEQGALLANIDNPELASLLKREQANLELLEVELETLRNQIRQRELADVQTLTLLKIRLEAERRELDRMAKIVDDGSISVNDFEKTKDEVHALEVQVENSEQQNTLSVENHALELRTKALSIDQQRLLTDDLSRQVAALEIRSPVDGVIGNIQVKEQDTVTKKQPIMKIVDLSSYQLEVLIPETYADSLSRGLAVNITHRNQEHEGTLESVSPQVTQGSVAGRVVFAGAAPTALRENLRLNARIILEEKANVLKVRRGPFVESHGGRGAYVMEGGEQDASMATFREIEIGSVSLNEVEVLSGLRVGDRVIISNTVELVGAERVLITN